MKKFANLVWVIVRFIGNGRRSVICLAVLSAIEWGTSSWQDEDEDKNSKSCAINIVCTLRIPPSFCQPRGPKGPRNPKSPRDQESLFWKESELNGPIIPVLCLQRLSKINQSHHTYFWQWFVSHFEDSDKPIPRQSYRPTKYFYQFNLQSKYCAWRVSGQK